MREFLKRTLFLSFIAVILVLTLSFSQSYLYRVLPSDYSRHAIILDVLNDNLINDNIIIFGDSRTMFGVDSRIIKDSLKFKGDVFNLSSVGQGLYESSYFYSLVNNKTKIVIQCVNPGFFSKNINHALQDSKAISMFLSGYRLNDETKRLIPYYNRFFDNTNLYSYFISRSYNKSIIHNILQPIFDNEIMDKIALKSLNFPHVYTSLKHPNYPVYKYNCAEFINREQPLAQLEFLKNVNLYFKNKNIRYIVVLMPINPDECRECYNNFKSYRTTIENTSNTLVLNLTDYIQDTNLYYDATHLNKKGAIVFSNKIAEELKDIYN